VSASTLRARFPPTRSLPICPPHEPFPLPWPRGWAVRRARRRRPRLLDAGVHERDDACLPSAAASSGLWASGFGSPARSYTHGGGTQYA
jgi:hypothetical protein